MDRRCIDAVGVLCGLRCLCADRSSAGYPQCHLEAIPEDCLTANYLFDLWTVLLGHQRLDPVPGNLLVQWIVCQFLRHGDCGRTAVKYCEQLCRNVNGVEEGGSLLLFIDNRK